MSKSSVNASLSKAMALSVLIHIYVLWYASLSKATVLFVMNISRSSVNASLSKAMS